MTDQIGEENKARAAAWFRALRDEIVAAFESLEDEQTQADPVPAGRFEVSTTKRASDDGSDAGGGLIRFTQPGETTVMVRYLDARVPIRLACVPPRPRSSAMTGPSCARSPCRSLAC